MKNVVFNQSVSKFDSAINSVIFQKTKQERAICFLEKLQKELLSDSYPANGVYMLLEDASGEFIDEDEVESKLYEITNSARFSRYMGHLYNEYSKINPIFKKYALIAIDECLEEIKGK